MLALLVTSPGHRRARSWIQDKLWSDRGPAQGAASLRQCLTEIRKAFGANSDVLWSSNGFLSLDSCLVDVCDVSQAGDGRSELFEGLDDIRDAEFEHWLRDTRADRASTFVTAEPAVATSERVPTVVLLEESQQCRSEQWFASELNGQIAQSLHEVGNLVLLQSMPRPPNPDSFALLTRSFVEDAVWYIQLRLLDGSRDRILWRTSRKITSTGHIPLESLETRELVRQAVTAVLDHVCQGSHVTSPMGQAFLAQKLIFSLDPENFSQAGALLSDAYMKEPRAAYLAWQSFLQLTPVHLWIPPVSSDL